MFRLKALLIFTLLLFTAQESGVVFEGICEPLIEYARENAEAKEEFVCHAERKKVIPAAPLASFHRPFTLSTRHHASESHQPVVNRVIRYRSLLI
jgi:hypothetical protein